MQCALLHSNSLKKQNKKEGISIGKYTKKPEQLLRQLSLRHHEHFAICVPIDQGDPLKYLSSIDVVRRIKFCLANDGFNVDHLFAQAGLDRLERHNPPNEDPFRLSDKFSYLWETLTALSGDAMLGFRVAPPHPICWLGVFGHLLMSSKNLKIASENVVRYLPLMTPTVRATIEQMDDTTVVGLHLVPGKFAVPQQRYDFTWNMLLSTLRFVSVQPNLRPIMVEYMFPEPESVAAYEEKFGCPVRFNAPRNAMHFADDHLMAPIPTSNHLAAEGLFRMLDERLQQVAHVGFTLKVRNLLISMIDQGGALREAVAAQLLISERTLQRRLESEGTDFSTLVDEVRKELAEQYLAGVKLPLKEMSFRLGFSDPRAFHRACVRWFGQPPSKFQLKNAV
jgi:AraC-like DNA-binding protein